MTRLKLDKSFVPRPEDDDDELFALGVFVFNVTRLLAFVTENPEKFPLGSIDLAELPDFGDDNLHEATIATADLSRPILQAEISPSVYSVLDGHHRIARARRERVTRLPCYRVPFPHHVPFLTSKLAYERYVEYWNSKIRDS